MQSPISRLLSMFRRFRPKNLESVTSSTENMARRLKEADDAKLAEMEKSQQYKRAIDGLKLENARLQKELDETKTRQESSEEGEGKKLLELWAIHFPRMKFESRPIRWTVRKKHKDRMSLEKKLKELHDSDDPRKLSIGKMYGRGEHHLGFRLDDGLECRLYYLVERDQITVSKIGTNQDTH